MGANEPTENEAQREPGEDTARSPVRRPPDGGHELPLFLRNRSDGRKGNEQDEKDEVGE
ncbi:MAG: hypothetical protein LC795_17265 [Acidobacteria bacterium]|nr:hypothetical protein [Acidobacteriota bacterium]